MPLPFMRLASLAAALLIVFVAAAPVNAQNDELQETSQLLKQGQLDRALERVDAYLKTRPKDARGRFLRGLILTEQNKPNDAIKAFTELTQDYPELPEPYNNLAVLYASQGQYDKARASLEMAIRTHPSYSTAHENLGDIYAKMASQAYDKALQLDKGNTPLQTKLNLIKDLFTGTSRPPKVAAVRPDAGKVAVATPSPKPVAPATPVAPVAPVTPKPAAEPVVKPAAPKATRSPDEVLKTVNQWARDWAENDVAGYLGHYAPDFKTPKGEARSDWEARRKALIAKPRKIRVDVESPKVVFNDNGRATVAFRQHYESGQLKITSNKTLVMVKSGDKWLIQQERVGG
jgi:tetratricopeptide (TPR) repeat protein